MEEHRKNIERILKHTTQRKAPDDLASRVLSSWKVETHTISEVPPLISKRTWALIGLALVGFVYWVLSGSVSGLKSSRATELLGDLNLELDLSLLHVSPVVIASIAAFGVMIGISILIRNGAWKSNTMSIF